MGKKCVQAHSGCEQNSFPCDPVIEDPASQWLLLEALLSSRDNLQVLC